MSALDITPSWRRAALWLTILTVAAALVMFAASQIWKDWIGWVLLPWALAPAPLFLWLSNRLVTGDKPYRVAVIGLGIGALVQVVLALLTLEQYLLIVWSIRITGAYAESLYGLIVVFAPLYVGPAPFVGFLSGLVLRAYQLGCGPS